jgi:hypothetical protein
MRTTKAIEIPARMEQRIEKVICDLCGEERGPLELWKNPHEEYERESDPSGFMEANVMETEVRHKWGVNWCGPSPLGIPDSGDGEEIIFDVCATCFMRKLVPWMESQGAKIRKETWDW